MVTCEKCGKVQQGGVGLCENCGTPLHSWAYMAYTPLAEDIGLDRLPPDSQLTRELTEPLRELAGNHCPVCQNTNRPGALFCASCGLALRPETEEAASSGIVPTRAEGPGQLHPGALLHARYRIVRKVAQGGMGAVYEARDEAEGNARLAIKEMAQTALSTEERTQALKDFMREATILATLDHPNLPRFSGIFGEDAKYYLVMEFIQGQTLETVMSSSRDFLPEHRVIVWAAQLCSVLEHLHTQDPPIIYRDSKPGNVMLIDGGDKIKLIDFGIARFHRVGKINDSIAFGTAGYAPPEQYGNAQTDQRSDIYALGATLHHLLSGHDPGESPFHWQPIRYYNPRISRRVDAAIMRAVSMKPEARFQTVGEFALALGLLPKAAPAPAKAAAAVVPAPAPAKPVTAPTVGRPVREAKLDDPAAPSDKPKIAVSDEKIDFGVANKKAKKGGRRVNLVNVGGGELKGIVQSNVPWLAVSAQQFSGNTAELTLETRRRGLKTGRRSFPVPNLFASFRQGLQAWPLRLLVIAWIALFITQGAWLGANSLAEQLALAVAAGLGTLAAAQVALWVVARHVRLLVPAPKQNVGQVVVDSNGGTRQIDVSVLARPAWLRLALGWTLVIFALLSELCLVALVLYEAFYK